MKTLTTLLVLVFLFAFTSCSSSSGGGGGSIEDLPVQIKDSLTTDNLFDLNKFYEFEIELSDADWQWLQDNAFLEEYVPATILFEGNRYEDAALRFKGGWGSLESCFDGTTQICPKLSLKISLVKYGNSRIAGVRKINFHSSVRDASFMHEVIGYYMFRAMGVAAPRASHAKLTVNGEYLGVFVMVEQIDKEFIQDHWDEDAGNLFKRVWPIYDFPDPYIEALRRNTLFPDVSRMLDFYDLLLGTTDENFIANFTGLLDFDNLARYFAVDRAISNNDGIKAFYCYGIGSTECENSNFYWYEEPFGATHLIPWDLDYTFGSVNTDLSRSFADPNPGGCVPVSFCEINGLVGDECTPDDQEVFLLPSQCDPLYGMIYRATWDDYIAALTELAAGPLSREVIVPLVREIRAKIRNAVIADPSGPGAEKFDQYNRWMDDVLKEQLIEVQTLIDEETL